MRVDVERIPESQVQLTFEVEPETVEKYVQRAYRSLVNRINVPGFRRGKAPRFMVERMVGKDTLLQEAMELLLPDIYKQAIEEKDLQPIGQPEWDVPQTEPLIAKAKVPVKPTVELGNYKDIRLAKEKPQVTDEQVQSVIENLREQRTQWVPVERPAEMGDKVTVDIEAHIKGESLLEAVGGGALVEGTGERLLNTKGIEYPLRAQPDAPLPGLSEQIVGVGPGQEKDFEITLPESYPEPQHAGKKAAFHILVHTVKEPQKPELNDEFAASIGNYRTVSELLDDLRKEIQQRLDSEAEQRFAEAVVQMVVDHSTVEMPKVMIDHESERSVERMINQFKQQGLSFEQYQQGLGKTREQIIEEMRPDAEKRLRNALVLDAVARAENVSVAPEEIDEEIDRLTAPLGEQAEKVRQTLNTAERREELSYAIWERKVIKLLTDVASQNDSQPEPSEVSDGPAEEAQVDHEG